MFEICGKLLVKTLENVDSVIEDNTLSDKQINASSVIGKTTPFLEFMLNIILETVKTSTH